MPDPSPSQSRRPWRVAFLLLAALTIAAQLAGLAWVAKGQVERGRALQGGGSVTRLSPADLCLDPGGAARVRAGEQCGVPGTKSRSDVR
jgi:hypothetical protein